MPRKLEYRANCRFAIVSDVLARLVSRNQLELLDHSVYYFEEERLHKLERRQISQSCQSNTSLTCDKVNSPSNNGLLLISIFMCDHEILAH